MLLQQVDRNELQLILAQLDQAIYNHQQWYNDLARTLACRLPCDQHDISVDAHNECRFGQWYYNYASPNLRKHEGYIAIGDAHQHMHELARRLLIDLAESNTIIPLDYDNFANSLERLRLEIYALKSELENLLYNRDPLTMAINRVTMLPILREQQDITKRQSQSCCLAMMDIDIFKQVNDKHGHIAGDKVLAAISKYLIEHLRQYDKIFRYGGEEFLLCLQQVSLDQAYEMIDRLRAEIASLPIDIGQPEPLFVTVSFGVTMLDLGSTVEQSIDHADQALYSAKNAGRNQTQTWVEKVS